MNRADMLRIERILCPTDFSESSARAYDYAQSLARHYRANLFLSHVVDFGLPPYEYYTPAVDFEEVFRQTCADARDQLQEFAKSHTRNGVQPECFVQEGAVTDSILSFAEAQMVDIIVMGTHGLKGLDRVTLGSVAEKGVAKSLLSSASGPPAGTRGCGRGRSTKFGRAAKGHSLPGLFRAFAESFGVCAFGSSGI